MPRSNLIYQALGIIPTLWFFIPVSMATGFFLFWRGLKPATSSIIALSAPGVASAVIAFLLTIFYKFQTSLAPMHFNIVLAMFMVAAFPTHIVCPFAFFYSVRRYISENEDYTIGFGYIILLLLMLASILISHLLVTSQNYDM
jgi:hypothetical protein